jgi:hypothetical protein
MSTDVTICITGCSEAFCGKVGSNLEVKLEVSKQVSGTSIYFYLLL